MAAPRARSDPPSRDHHVARRRDPCAGRHVACRVARRAGRHAAGGSCAASVRPCTHRPAKACPRSSRLLAPPEAPRSGPPARPPAPLILHQRRLVGSLAAWVAAVPVRVPHSQHVGGLCNRRSSAIAPRRPPRLRFPTRCSLQTTRDGVAFVAPHTAHAAMFHSGNR